MANSVGISDKTSELLKLVASKAGMSQAEAVNQGLILYAEQLGLVKTKETRVEVVKRTYEINDADWTSQESPKH